MPDTLQNFTSLTPFFDLYVIAGLKFTNSSQLSQFSKFYNGNQTTEQILTFTKSFRVKTRVCYHIIVGFEIHFRQQIPKKHAQICFLDVLLTTRV